MDYFVHPCLVIASIRCWVVVDKNDTRQQSIANWIIESSMLPNCFPIVNFNMLFIVLSAHCISKFYNSLHYCSPMKCNLNLVKWSITKLTRFRLQLKNTLCRRRSLLTDKVDIVAYLLPSTPRAPSEYGERKETEIVRPIDSPSLSTNSFKQLKPNQNTIVKKRIIKGETELLI